MQAVPGYVKSVFLLTCLFALIFLSFEAGAQDAYLQAFNPELGKMRSRIFYEAELYSGRDVAGQNKDFSVIGHNAGFSAPIFQDQGREWSGSASLGLRDIRTDAVLPASGVRFPQNLWDVRFGTQYRQRLENGWIAGGLLGFGSASDEPFHSYDEMTIQGTAYARIPHGNRNAWFLFVNYSNNREFLNHVPIPGFGYWYVPTDRVQIMAGLPFLFLHAGPYDGYSVEASYFPIRDVRLKISKILVKEARIYTSFQWRNETYFRAERSDSDQRLFYYEKRAAAGVEYDLFKDITVDLSAGYAFDRFYFEGESYSDRGQNRLDIGNSPYLAAKIALSF